MPTPVTILFFALSGDLLLGTGDLLFDFCTLLFDTGDLLLDFFTTDSDLSFTFVDLLLEIGDFRALSETGDLLLGLGDLLRDL